MYVCVCVCVGGGGGGVQACEPQNLSDKGIYYFYCLLLLALKRKSDESHADTKARREYVILKINFGCYSKKHNVSLSRGF